MLSGIFFCVGMTLTFFPSKKKNYLRKGKKVASKKEMNIFVENVCLQTFVIKSNKSRFVGHKNHRISGGQNGEVE